MASDVRRVPFRSNQNSPHCSHANSSTVSGSDPESRPRVSDVDEQTAHARSDSSGESDDMEAGFTSPIFGKARSALEPSWHPAGAAAEHSAHFARASTQGPIR